MSRNGGRVLAMGAAASCLGLVAYLTQFAGASASEPSTLSSGEAVAGILAVGDGYPGGLPALLRLFETGECAGIESYGNAPPACRSILDAIVHLGSGRPIPATIPDLAGETDTTVPPPETPDPTDRITPELITALEAAGFPADLLDGLRRTPPVIPPPYDTWPPVTLTPLPPPDTPLPTIPLPTALPPPSTTPPPPPSITPPPTTAPPTQPPTTPPPTTQPPPTTTPVAPPPHVPPLLVAVGDSVTSGHEARRTNAVVWRTSCDDPGTADATPGSSWAGDLRALIGVGWNSYHNFAHSGSSTGEVLTATPYTNPCGVVSQQARPQIDDATAVLAARPSQPGRANVAVATAAVNNTNWVAVATQLVRNTAPAWATNNVGACIDWALGNPAGNATPGAPAGAIPPAWDGLARSPRIALDTTTIALRLIAADPGAQVRYLYYYRWMGDPNLPAICGPAAFRATTTLNGWIGVGILAAQVAWAIRGGAPNRIQAVCQQLWNPGRNFVQDRLMSWGIPNNVNVPGWPHPNANGRTSLANCVNATLPRTPGGGIA